MHALALMLLLVALAAGHAGCRARARRRTSRLMRPAADLEPEDVDRWLSLIEPFPLGRTTRPRR